MIGVSLVLYALAEVTYEKTMEFVGKVEKFVNDPIAMIRRMAGWNHKPLRSSKKATTKAKTQTAQTGKNLSELNESMEKHIDIIQKKVAVITVGKRLGPIQKKDSVELGKLMTALSREGRTTGFLLKSGAQDSAILTGKVDDLYPMAGESDIDFRVRLKDEIIGFRRGTRRFRETISNMTLQVKLFKDKSFDFKENLAKKKTKYDTIHKDAKASKKSFVRRATEIGSAFCAGAATGAGAGVYLAWNPIAAVAVSGVSSFVSGGFAAAYTYFNSKSTTETVDESLATMIEIDGMSYCVDGMLKYLGSVDLALFGMDRESSDILVGLDNLEVSNGQIRFVKLVAKSFGAINTEFQKSILNNNIGLDALKPLTLESTAA